MNGKIILLIFFWSLYLFSHSQYDTINNFPIDEKKIERFELLHQSLLLPEIEKINQLDSIGKKDGKWTEYLNSRWKILPDSNHAVYYRYVYYDHGIKILREMYDNTNKKLEYIGDTIKKTKPILLDGEYKWYDKKGRLLTDVYYKNGDHVWYKGYTWNIFTKKLTGKQIHENFDFTKTYHGQPYTAYYEQTDKKGVVTIYYLRKGKSGWCLYKE